MNPSADPNSPLAALRQLQELLDAGTITPAEFEALKRRLIFGTDENLAVASAAPAPAEQDTAAPIAEAPAANAPGVEGQPVAAVATEPLATLTAAASEEPVEEIDTFAPATAAPLRPQDWMAALAPSMVPVIEADRVATADTLPTPDRRNPLALVFAIGGVLLLLAVFGYLLFGLPPKTDEHLSSTSQTPADTVRTRPETGPQSEQLTLPPVAAPETLRVAPPRVVRPVVPVPAAATKFRGDSVAKPLPTVPATTPTTTDSTATKP